MKRKLDSILNVIGEGSYKVTTEILRIALVPALIGLGWWIRGQYQNFEDSKSYGPEILEFKQEGLRVKAYIDGKDQPQLFYDKHLSEDPNAVVFTSKNYQDSLANRE